MDFPLHDTRKTAEGPGGIAVDGRRLRYCLVGRDGAAEVGPPGAQRTRELGAKRAELLIVEILKIHTHYPHRQ